MVIWMGNPSGGDLRPGARPRLRSANGGEDARRARRTPTMRPPPPTGPSALQIVLARPGAASGALVAPLLTPDGCIGAFSAEIKGRGETSDATQALVVLFAAQLASVLGPVSIAEAPAEKIATA